MIDRLPNNGEKVRNGFRHGANMVDASGRKHPFGLTLALRIQQMPHGCRYISLAVQQLRTSLMHDLLDENRLTKTTYAVTGTIARLEARAMLVARWLRAEGDKLTFDQKLAALKTITDASERRDKMLVGLKLDRDSLSAMQSFYSSAYDDEEASKPLESSDLEDAAGEPPVEAQESENFYEPIEGPTVDAEVRA